MTDLPPPKDSLLARYTGEAFKALRDTAAAPYIAVARTLLGQLRNRLALGGIAAGAHSVTLPDGTRVKVGVYGAINKMWIEPPEPEAGSQKEIVVRLAFLVYEKWFYSPGGVSSGEHGYPYGYYLSGENKYPRSIPYVVGEPDELPLTWEEYAYQCASITEIRFVPDKTEVKVIEGTNLRYGNQYYCDGRNVWSWWHSPFGDLPWLEFDDYAELYATNMRYAPAYVAKNDLGFVYMTEIPEVPGKPPLHIYRNGKIYATCPGLEGHALVAGMGHHAESGTYLVARCGYSSIDLLALNETTVRLIGQVFASDGIACHPVRFNAEGTKFTTLGYFLDNDTDKITLHWVEYSIAYNAENYNPSVALEFTFTQIRKTPYYAMYTDHGDAYNTYTVVVNGPGVPPDRGTLIASNTDTYIESTTSNHEQKTVYEFPVVAYYDGEDDASVALLNYTNSTVYTYFNTPKTEISTQCSWWNIWPEWPTLAENRNTTILYRNQVIKTVYRKVATLSFGGTTLEIDDVSDTYHYHFYNKTIDNMNEAIYTDFSVVHCANNNLSYNATKKINNPDALSQTSEDSRTIEGYTSQLKSLDTTNSVCGLVKTTYDIRRVRDFTMDAIEQQTQTLTYYYYNCADPVYDFSSSYSNINSASVRANEGLGSFFEESSASFYISTPTVADKKVGADYGLVAVSTADTVVSGEITFEYFEPDGSDIDPDDLAVYNGITGEVTSITTPAWVHGPLIAEAKNNDTYTHNNVTPNIAITADLLRGFLLRHWKGSGSLRSDATQDGSGSGIQSLLTGKPDTPWRYVFNEAGYFTTPEYTFYPGSVEARGGEFANVFDTSLDWTPNAVPDPQSQYPIGFYMTEIEA